MEPTTIALIVSGTLNVVLVILHHMASRDKRDARVHMDNRVQEAQSNGFIRGMDCTVKVLRILQGDKK